jgi:membrane protein
MANGGFAGSLFIILAWVYYSSQIIFFGAKFTAVYAKRIGKPIQFQE